jgi:CubicO group peptidase (beta-lactamase class C family)
MNRIFELLAAIIIIPGHLFCQSPDFPIERLDSFAVKAMNDWHLMGLAIGIVKKDTLILAKGYGYRDYMNITCDWKY